MDLRFGDVTLCPDVSNAYSDFILRIKQSKIESEDYDSTILWNDGKCLPKDILSLPRKLPFSSVLLYSLARFCTPDIF